MATATIQFVYSVTTINPPTPDYPKRVEDDLVQSVQRSMDGRVVSELRSTTSIKTHVLKWEYMPDADFATLKTFWYTTVQGAKNAVTYTDEDATAFTVRYLKGLETAREVDTDFWSVELHLAEE